MRHGATDNALTIRDFWTVHETVDEYGRRGALIGVFSTEEKATMVAAGRGWYGGDASVTQVKGIVAPDQTVYIIANLNGTEHPNHVVDRDLKQYKQELKEAALAKLSPAEKAALELK